ncbi:MAG: radical SAM protein [Candidatus Omnitrophota bacterium]
MIRKLPYTLSPRLFTASLKLFLKLPKPAVKWLLDLSVRLRRSRFEKSHSLSDLIFFVTNRCNMSCGFCFLSGSLNKNVDAELTLEEIGLIAARAKGSVDKVLLTGGEPFIRKDLADIAKAFYSAGGIRKINVNTNGFYTDRLKEFLDRMISDCPEVRLTIQVSIDAPEVIHNRMRGSGEAYGHAVNTLKLLLEYRDRHPQISNVVAGVTLSADNFMHLGELLAVLRTLGDMMVGINFVRGSHASVGGRPPCELSENDPSDSHLLTAGQIDHVAKTYSAGVDPQSRYFFFEKLVLCMMLQKKELLVNGWAMCLASWFRCYAGRAFLILYATGDVALCEMTRSFANIRREDYNLKSVIGKARGFDTAACACSHECNLFHTLTCDTKWMMLAFNEDLRF